MTVLRALRRWWVLAIAVTVMVAVGVTALSLVVPKTYTASAVIAVVPKPGSSPSGELVRIAVPTYANLAASETVAVQVADRLGVDVNRLNRAITAQVIPSTNNVFVSVRWQDPGQAAEMANAVVDELLEFSTDDPLLNALVVAPAVPLGTESFPAQPAMIALGVLLALVAGPTAAVIRQRREVNREDERGVTTASLT